MKRTYTKCNCKNRRNLKHIPYGSFKGWDYCPHDSDVILKINKKKERQKSKLIIKFEISDYVKKFS